MSAATEAPTRRVLGLLAPLWPRLLPAAAASAAAEIAALALMATAAWLIASAAHQPPIGTLAVAIVAVRALALGRGALRYADRLAGHEVVLGALARMRARVYRALVPLAPAGTAAFRSGELLTKLVDDVDAVQDLLLRCLIPATAAAVVAVVSTGLSFALLPTAGAVLAVGLLVAGALVPAVTFAVWTRTRGAGEDHGELAARTVDLTRGAADLAAFGATGTALARAARAADSLAAAQRRKARTTGVAGAVGLAVQGLTAVAVAVLALRSGAPGDAGDVVLAVVALTAFEPVAPLPECARRFADVRASARRLVSVLDTPSPVAEPVEPARPVEPPFAVELTGVRVRHRPDAAPALDGVDLRLEPRRRVAVVGASGSGKSTLLAVLMRFVEPDSGVVLLGGRPLGDHHGDQVRALITGVTQDDHVFHASVRDNIALAKPGCGPAELRAAAGRARLLEWIESLPQGWDTLVGEGGAAMSGGQRQRLLLARALLADPPVLLLDEPTEGLDAETADAVLADILAATRDRTTVLVTHRPAGLAGVDEVVVLDAGRVLARGTHAELLARPDYVGAALT